MRYGDSEMKKRKSVAMVIVALVVVVATLLFFVGRSREVAYIGTVEATKVDISPRVSSVIASFDAKEGNKVKSGDVLVRLSDEEMKIAAEMAAQDYNRAVKLFKTGSMPQEAYEHLKSKRDETALKLEWCTIRSPLNGTVLNTYRESGEWVSPGVKLLTLADLSEVWAMIYVAEPLLAKLSLGMPVKTAISEQEDRFFDGKITKISDEAEFTPKNVQTWSERTRLVYGVKVTFPNPESLLKPGMAVRVYLPESKRK